MAQTKILKTHDEEAAVNYDVFKRTDKNLDGWVTSQLREWRYSCVTGRRCVVLNQNTTEPPVDRT